MHALLFESGLVLEADAHKFWNLVTGFHSDHAEDQKKLFRLLQALKQQMEREARGERVVKSMAQVELLSLAFKCSQLAVEKAGGPNAYDALSDSDKVTTFNAARAQLVRDIGQADFDALDQDVKDDVDLFLWAGCCMHKDMNAFKGMLLIRLSSPFFTMAVTDKDHAIQELPPRWTRFGQRTRVYQDRYSSRTFTTTER
jgi:hypothetical protein